MAKEKRFEVLLNETPAGSLMTNASILRDMATGVLYLLACYGSAGGLTPLLGADGKPLVWDGGDTVGGGR